MSLSSTVKSKMGELEDENEQLRKKCERLDRELEKLRGKIDETESQSGIPKTKEARAYIDKRIRKWVKGNSGDVAERLLDASGLAGLDRDVSNLRDDLSGVSESINKLREYQTETRETVNGIIDRIE